MSSLLIQAWQLITEDDKIQINIYDMEYVAY